MKYVTISDKDDRNVLTFDLKNVLEVIGNRPAGWTWMIQGLECTGPSAEIIHGLSDSGRRVEDKMLVDLLNGVMQTIDGSFLGYPQDAVLPAIVVRADDSSCFDVLSDDQAILKRIQERFREVTVVREWPCPSG